MNTNDLYLEYARVIQMCKGTELENKPVHCVRWKWKGTDKWFYSQDDGHPNLNDFMLNQDVDFAVAVLKGRPVFVGDAIYTKYGDGVIVSHGAGISMDGASWTPPTPKRTFTLNSVELPCPKPKFKEGTDWTFDISGYLFGFDTKEECDSVYQAIIKLLTEARDKP